MQVINDTNFKSEVLENEQPTLVDFFAEWCGPCKMIAPLVEEMASEYAAQMKFVKMDTDESPATAQRYEDKGIPTLLIFKGGQPIARSVGYLDQKRLREFIENNLG